jgi:hypothetical protein
MDSRPGGGSSRGARGIGARPAGLRVLIPGAAQWYWRQRERGLVFFGSFAAALVVGLFCWGTPTGAAILAFAFGAHVAATADAIRQWAFPGFGRLVPTVSASVGLGLGCYAPALAMASVLAWPGGRLGDPQEGYLVNRWAYRDQDPRSGHWVWVEATSGRGHGVAQVLAGPGEGVQWSDGHLWVGGQAVEWKPPRGAHPPRHLAFTVPDDQILIGVVSPTRGEISTGMALIPRQRLAGRAWARIYPVWGRRLLF